MKGGVGCELRKGRITFGAGRDGGVSACCVIRDCCRPSYRCVDQVNKVILNIKLILTIKLTRRKVRLRKPTRKIFHEVEHVKRELVLFL